MKRKITMEIFQNTRKYLRVLGYFQSNPTTGVKYEKTEINIFRNIFVFAACIFYFVAPLSYLIFVAENFSEYAAGFFNLSDATYVLISYSVFNWQKPKIIQHIVKLETIIQSSKLNISKSRKIIVIIQFQRTQWSSIEWGVSWYEYKHRKMDKYFCRNHVKSLFAILYHPSCVAVLLQLLLVGFSRKFI